MEGYRVVTSDDCKMGQVVAIEGDNLIIEHGTLKKTKHAIPKTFAHTDEAEQTVRVSVSKEIVENSPKLDNGVVDTRAVAEHYGLAEGIAQPETEGYGDLVPDDPGRSAEEDELRLGVETAPQERVRVRQEMRPGDIEDDTPPSPGVLGGDRYRDVG